MKRPVLALLTLLVATSLVADETRRYIVVTKRPVRTERIAATLREMRADVQPRAARAFDSVNGFAADLTEAEVATLQQSPNVAWVEPVLERHALGEVAANATSTQSTPYGIGLIHAPEVWIGATGKAINVVVVDTGIDFNHPELKAIYAGGMNTFDANKPPFDDNSHGTHVAGTIAAADNDIGVVGIAPQVRLWGIKVLDANGSGTSEKLIRAIDWTIAKQKELGGNWVMNFSLGASRGSKVEGDAFQKAVDAGIIVVAASGNDSELNVPKPVLFPAAYPGIVTVGAVDSNSQLATFSNQGREMDLVAPGVGVLSTVPVGKGELSYVAGKTRVTGRALGGSPYGTINRAWVYVGLGRKEDIPTNVAGKIALVKRGEIRFSEKARNLKEAGAVGIVIFNNDTSDMNWTLKPSDEPQYAQYEYPLTVGITLAAGEEIIATNPSTLTVSYEKDDYASFNGTSMATPHVAGAAALLWSLQPNFTASTIINALTFTAKDLGSTGPDDQFGVGLVNVFDAAKLLSPSTFGQAPPPSGRRILRRGRG